MVVAQITHSPFAIATDVHGAFTKQSLRSVGFPAVVLSNLNWFASGGPLAAKRTIHGSHTWSGGPSTATQFAADGPEGTSCGGGPTAA